jgi:galactokinase
MNHSLIDSFRKFYTSEPEICSSAPGRINIIGEHTDYNLGYVLPAAIHLRVFFLVSRRTDGTVRVWAENFQQEQRFMLGKYSSSGKKSWMSYVKGIFWVLSRLNAPLQGIDAFIFGEIPLESGLSSSAALEVSIINGLNELFHLGFSDLELAKLAQKAEIDFVGVKCGIMDQFISVFGKKDTAFFLDCDTLESEPIPLRLEEAGLEILVCDTGVRRNLASSEYNKRRLQAEKALKILKTKGANGYKDISLSWLNELKSEMDYICFRRARHIITENTRVNRAVSALRKNDFDQLGKLLFESHESLRDDYEVSCPELDLLYECGKSFSPCLGARLVGAGFGGAGLALLESRDVSAFQVKVCDMAEKRGFVKPTFHRVKIGSGKKIQTIHSD